MLTPTGRFRICRQTKEQCDTMSNNVFEYLAFKLMKGLFYFSFMLFFSNKYLETLLMY